MGRKWKLLMSLARIKHNEDENKTDLPESPMAPISPCPHMPFNIRGNIMHHIATNLYNGERGN